VNWSDTRVLVTGGCSFIGSHLVEHLLTLGVRRLRVVDDLSTGYLANIGPYVDDGRVEFVQGDLREPHVARVAVTDIDLVFHLAAIHGGRGYIDQHQSACADNFMLDGNVVRAAHAAGVDKLVFTSSGCVYPVGLQADVDTAVWLAEPMVGPPFHADGIYGWAKLMTELMLQAYYRERGLKSASCRLFTAYGERCLESHAVIAMVGRAFLRQDPFDVWGDGRQIRNWTYVGDIVRGLSLAAEKIDDATAVNLGTEEPVRVIDAARLVLQYTGHDATIRLRPDMPTGPLNRVASNALARERLGWQPTVRFADGLRRTIDWYFEAKEQQRAALAETFETLLVER
jgi:nucleoside-diphosphate-sugar epimerase